MITKLVGAIQQRQFWRRYPFPIVSLNDLIKPSHELILDLRDWDSDGNAGDFIDGLIFAAITRTLKPALLWELGTGYGRTGLIAARNTPDDAEIFTIDCDGTGNLGRIFRDRPEAKPGRGRRISYS
jgi:hypothetical protein